MAATTPAPRIKRIISGGQTGVDRSALDVAIELGVDHGGWCPRGRRAEDGVIPAHYRLQECDSSAYHVRTELNVRESDGTLILFFGQLSGGTALTLEFAKKLSKPCLLVDLTGESAVAAARDWLIAHDIAVLNVAGPRENSAPGIGRLAAAFVTQLLSPTKETMAKKSPRHES